MTQMTTLDFFGKARAENMNRSTMNEPSVRDEFRKAHILHGFVVYRESFRVCCLFACCHWFLSKVIATSPWQIHCSTG